MAFWYTGEDFFVCASANTLVCVARVHYGSFYLSIPHYALSWRAHLTLTIATMWTMLHFQANTLIVFSIVQIFSFCFIQTHASFFLPLSFSFVFLSPFDSNHVFSPQNTALMMRCYFVAHLLMHTSIEIKLCGRHNQKHSNTRINRCVLTLFPTRHTAYALSVYNHLQLSVFCELKWVFQTIFTFEISFLLIISH